MTTRREANRQRPRLALAGGLSAITRPFPLLLFRDWRKVRQDGRRPESGRERKETGGEDVSMYMHGGRVEECPGALGPNRFKEGQMEGGKKVWMHGCSIAYRHKLRRFKPTP